MTGLREQQGVLAAWLQVVPEPVDEWQAAFAPNTIGELPGQRPQTSPASPVQNGQGVGIRAAKRRGYFDSKRVTHERLRMNGRLASRRPVRPCSAGERAGG